MAEWAYKSSTKKVDEHKTGRLAHRGFVCRAAFDERLGREQPARNVADVQIGDRLHLYCRNAGSRILALGTYRICRPDELTDATWAVEPVEGTALYKVTEAFVRAVDEVGGYQPDPVLGEFTGWLVKREGSAPKYDPTWHPGQLTLAKVV